MSKELLDIVERVANERNIPVSALFEGIEISLIAAAKRMLDNNVEVTRARIDRMTGKFNIFAQKQVVEEVEDEELEISLGEAQLDHPSVKIGDVVEIDITPADFGRIAAQSAKQVVMQHLRDAEREMVFEQYVNRAGDLVTGNVQRYERGNVMVDLGVTEGKLPYSEQAFGERYRIGERIKCLITEVNREGRDAQVILSRKNPDLVRRLFEKEVAEIHDGTVVIRTIAREAGRRTKIAVYSIRSDVDPVGACVGMKGSRVQMVVQELRGERIDIIEYSNDRRKFIANSLKPAHVDPESVELYEDVQRAMVTVPDEQLYLAIGKNGLNAKLASQMTGVEIDIVSEGEVKKSEALVRRALMAIDGITEERMKALMALDVFSYQDIVDIGIETLQNLPDVTEELAAQILTQAQEYMENPPDLSEPTEDELSEEEPEFSEAESANGSESEPSGEQVVSGESGKEAEQDTDNSEPEPEKADTDTVAEEVASSEESKQEPTE